MKNNILQKNSMTVRILLTVAIGIFLAVVSVTMIIINISKEVFVDTYGKSQEKVFLQIKEDLNSYHENLGKIISSVESSWAFRLYFGDEQMDSQMAFQISYEMNTELQYAIPTNISNVSVMIVGMNGKQYLNREETIILPAEEILASPIAEDAIAGGDAISYHYAETGFTSTTRNIPVIMAVKPLYQQGSPDPYAVIFITMKETDMSKYYNFFVSEYSQFYMVQADQETIVSTDQKELVGREFTEDICNQAAGNRKSNAVTVLKEELYYYNYIIYGVIDSEKALGRFYNVPQLWILCILIGAAAVVFAFISVRQTTKPLSGLVEKMANAREEKYDDYIKVTGSYEIQQLTSTYNSMLDDLHRYIDELMAIQKEKRKAEISALQMQINPHYVYNTLASIKWMIYQGDVEKSTKAIDAFIALLRSTIGNMDEYLTVEQEVENLKNYVLINNIRYGNKVQVEYFVSFGCEGYLMPKMILQPFVENAFFHAFPYERQGRITILVREMGENLQIRIVDNGVGMNQERLKEISEGNMTSEHFTGIGVNNVNDRLKLIYGEDYGINITSEEEKGTTITILVPIKGGIQI